ncbi:MAG: SGNH/GDSL hydrolase family protein [Candidatus Omnitrophica bacterium]|nr:SGNH/GDSL hydrolase family protein [Candidatus Omnitrophota bacterium]
MKMNNRNKIILRGLGIGIMLILIIEIFSTVALFFINTIIKKRPVDDFFLDKFAITRPISYLFPSSKNMDYFKDAKQKDIGNLLPTSEDKWKDLMPPDSILGWRLAKNVKCTHYNKYIYITNGQGFLSIGKTDFYYDPVKPKNVYRIIVVGASAVFGQGAYTPAENLPAMIYEYLQKINQGNGRKTVYEVINAGIGGYSSSQEFLYILTDLIIFQPDIIIVYDGWNDQSYNNLLLSQPGEDVNSLKSLTHYGLEERLRRSYTVLGSFSIFCGVVKSYANIYLNQSGAVTLLRMAIHKCKNINSAQKSLKYDYHQRSVEIYKENLTKMIMLANFYRFRIAIFLQPIMGADKKVLTPEEREIFQNIGDLPCRIQFYEAARGAFKDLRRVYGDDRKVIIKDLSESFNNINETVYADSGHLLLNGNRIMAKNIIDAINLSDVTAK